MIQINNLSKNYGPKKAVKNISFSISKGEIVGFLGPNGAGKSTTMNVLTGYLSASSGSASIAGFDILDDALEARRHIGYLPEQPPLYLEMTVDEYLMFVCELKNVKGSKSKHIREICDMTGISHVRKRVIKNLSKGYKQRVGIAQALVGNPDVLILDEPTVGLDPNQIVEIRNLIKNLGKDKTVILSTHIIPEVTKICKRVIVINDGEIVADDTVKSLLEDIGSEHGFVAEIEGERDLIISALREIDGVSKVEKLDNEYSIYTDKDIDIRKDVFFAMSKLNFPILSFKAVDTSLEAVFTRLTKKGGNK